MHTVQPFFQPVTTRINQVLLLWLTGFIIGSAYLLVPVYLFFPALAIVSVFVVGMVNPRYSLYMVAFLLTLERVHIFYKVEYFYEARFYVYEIPLLATFAGLALYHMAGKIKIGTTRIDVFVGLIMAVELMTILWTPSQESGALCLFFLFTDLIIFYAVVTLIDTEDALRTLITIWIIAGIITAALVMVTVEYEISKTIDFTRDTGLLMGITKQVERPAGIGGSDHVGGFLSSAIIMAYAVMFNTPTRGKKFAVFLVIAFMLGGMILTKSRGCLVGCFIGYMFFILLRPELRRVFYHRAIAGGATALLVILIITPTFIDRILIGFGYQGELFFSDNSYYASMSNTSEGEGLSGLELRYEWFKHAINGIFDEPLYFLFGEGVGSFNFYSAGYGATTSSPEVNNVMAAYFFDMGLIGLLILIPIILIMIREVTFCIMNSKDTYAYRMALGAFAVVVAEPLMHGLVDYDLVSYGSKYVWFDLGVAFALVNMVKKENGFKDRIE